MNKFQQFMKDELIGFNPRLHLAQFLGNLWPFYTGNRGRATLLRMLGFQVGSGTFFLGMPLLTGVGPIHERLHVGSACWFNIKILINLGAEVVIEDQVSVGHETMILTETHDLGEPDRRCGTRHALPVYVGKGAWLGSRVMVLPGVTIGAGAVVGAGALVAHDVPVNTLVAGVPAKVIRELPDRAMRDG